MSRLTRLMILLTVVVVVMISTAGPARAKGSDLYFDRLYVAAGETVTLSTEFSELLFGLRSRDMGSVDDGPYYAYLVPKNKGIDPPHIPRAAIPLGPLTIEPGAREGLWSASMSFVVPESDPGRYRVEICNKPCRQDSVGDLWGSTEFYVEATAEEARLKNLLHSWVSGIAQAWVPDVETNLRPELDAYRVDLALRMTRERLDLVQQLQEVQDEVAMIRAQQQATRTSTTDLEPGLWLAGWVVAAGVGGLWWLRGRRRRPSIRTRPAPV